MYTSLQHLYIEAGAGLSSEASLTAVLTGSSDRTWRIKVTQVRQGGGVVC